MSLSLTLIISPGTRIDASCLYSSIGTCCHSLVLPKRAASLAPKKRVAAIGGFVESSAFLFLVRVSNTAWGFGIIRSLLVAGGVGCLGGAWLAREVRGGEKLSILFLISSIRLLASSLYARNSNHILSSLARSSSFQKGMVMIWIEDCSRKQSTFALIPLDAIK
jgi:hypothetical protein